MIQYKYAKKTDGNLIKICDLNENNRKQSQYYCLSCGGELIPRLGTKKTHHFAHKNVVECNGETYLHILGKTLFYETYISCLNSGEPFTLEFIQHKTCNHFENSYGYTCDLGEQTNIFNLTSYFKRIELEKKEGNFIPDVKLFNDSHEEIIFIEIAVSHKSSNVKLESQYRILEISVESEEDLEFIKEKHISVKNPNVSQINFNKTEKKKDFCKGCCSKKYILITLDTDGRCLMKVRNINEIKGFLFFMKNIVEYKIIEYNNKSFKSVIFRYHLAIFTKKKLKIKNCYICRYHADNKKNRQKNEEHKVPIFCKFQKIQCNSNEAVICEYFRRENQYIEELLEKGEKLEIQYFTKQL